jgi:hypothetical protein
VPLPPSPTNTIVVATVRVFNTPPEISIIDLSPPELVIGRECPNRPRSTIVTVRVIDPTGIESVTATWTVGNQRGETKFVAVDDQTYQGEIGPVAQVGALVLEVLARDSEGAENAVRESIRVQTCIG